jgi:hypothetical protein
MQLRVSYLVGRCKVVMGQEPMGRFSPTY